MPIEKTTPTKLSKRGGTYVVLPSETICQIQNPEALAILTYLLDRPSDWIIRRNQIRERFNLGRDRYERAMRELHQLGLAWKETERDEAGHIINNTVCVKAEIPDHLSPSTQKTRQSGKPEPRENPNLGKSDHLHITDSIKHDISTTAKPKKAGPKRIDPNYMPSEKTVQRAIDLGMTFDNVDYLIAEFVEYWHDNQKRKADWDKTFMNHLKKKWEHSQGAANGKAKTASQILADDLNETISNSNN